MLQTLGKNYIFATYKLLAVAAAIAVATIGTNTDAHNQTNRRIPCSFYSIIETHIFNAGMYLR